MLFDSYLKEVESAGDIDIAEKGSNPERLIEGCSGASLNIATLARLFQGIGVS